MSSSSSKLCFNSNCKDVFEGSRKGWRRRTGEFADLCDRCATAYERGKFCETFHMNASGWRCCESCGKQIHCGCIVSFHMFVLLDAGGIECITCARKSFILTPNPAWPPPSLFLPAVPERVKDPPVKNWSSIAGSGPVPWRQAPSLFNASNPRPELHSRIPFEAEMPGAMNERVSALSVDKLRKDDSSENPTNGALKIDVSQQQPFIKNEPSVNHISFLSKSETNDQRSTTPSSLAIVKKIANHHAIHSSAEAQFLNVRPRGDLRGRNHLLPRYLPKMTDQELQQISGDSNSVITPLFEKMLSASDAGRIGRLVLPKKCAEAYFPPISQPEGLPLVVQDVKGKEWIFQFRYWPNNNSRMYVLEGVTPCIQSMQLQAGDVVTFSRLEPEGKLVMGFRKSSAVHVDQGNVTIMGGNEVSSNGVKPGESIFTNRLANVNSLATSYLPLKVIDQCNATAWAEIDKSGYIAKEGHAPQPIFRKRKSNNNNSLNNNYNNKRLKIENEMMELKLTWEQAQGSLRPPPNYVPSVVMVEGFEFEEYEDAPIIGQPTILATDHSGKKIQWAQCEDCLKWRKVPDDVHFPSRWTCLDNLWDPVRSTCSVAQELTAAQLVDLLPKNDDANCTKMKVTKEEPDSLEALEGLDTLANLAIQEEGDSPFTSPSQATTRHPRHRPGCTCIVCIQPPSGKGHKHKQSCTCNVCLTIKRRFRTLSLRRELKQSEKDSENNTSLTDNKTKLSDSPFKGQIDLNSQPEREEELSDSGGVSRLLAESKQHNFPNGSNSSSNQGTVDLDRQITSSSMDAIASSTAPER